MYDHEAIEKHFRKVKSNVEFYNWGERLHNCLFTYASSVKNRDSIIYGFFTEDEVIFAVEIKNNQIIQASCKYNAELDEEEKFTLYEWFGRFFNKPNEQI